MRSLITESLEISLVGLMLDCSGGAPSAKPEPEQKPECVPQVELCNGQDEDCDGVADNGFDELGQPCSVGQGECIDQGKFVCTTDGKATRCDAAPKQATAELCDQKDNDCDGVTDNGFNLANDPENCGSCGTVCSYPNAQGLCLNFQCVLGSCLAGFWNIDGQEDNGCEYVCNISQDGQEICDSQDNDCDGVIDNDELVLVSCNDNVDCTTDFCDFTIGQCQHLPEDSLCNNGNICDGFESCDADQGCLNGLSLVCDDNNICNGQETCDQTAGCQAGISLVCDDGLWCNGQETCDSVTGCLAGAWPVLSDGLDCTIDLCDEDNDLVVHSPDNSFCDDANVCNGLETCDLFKGCLAGASLICNDGQFCNGQESCDPVAGCQAGIPPTLSDNISCTKDTCDEIKDQVVHSPIDNSCNDGLWCNGQEWCDAVNGCQPGIAQAVSDEVECTVDFCDETEDKIVHVPNQVACDDGLWCNGTEYCDPSAGCQVGLSPILSDGIDCTVDTCNEDQIKVIHTPDSSVCFDNNVCNGIETCDLINDCLAGVPLKCDDGLWCNGTEACDVIKGCQSSAPPALSDNISCTEDVCDEAKNQIVHIANNVACSDNNICNGIETCDPIKDCLTETPLKCDDGLWCNGTEACDVIKGCQSSAPPALSDNISCTEDVCDETEDKIVHIVKNNFCNDANVCNGLETCDLSKGCLAGAFLVCDDGLWCNGQESCVSIIGCQAGLPPILSDDIACTIDTCDEDQNKVIHIPDNTVCSDKNICNGLETCSPNTGCQLGISLKCDDELWCNGQETCDSLKGCQSGASPNCLALNDQCNKGACNDTLDQCEKQSVNEGGACNDGTVCTSLTVCQNGFCVGEADKDSDGDGYIDDLCGGDDCDDTGNATHPGAEDMTDGYCFQAGFVTSKIPDTAYGSTSGSRVMGIDSKNNIHLLYSSTFSLYYVTNATDTGGWLQQKIASSTVSKSIAIDSNDKVHISYKKAGSDDLIYLTNQSGVWLETPIATYGNVGTGNSIGVDSSDEIHISYRDDKNSNLLQHATNVADDWAINAVDDISVGDHTSLAIDLDDKVHISYFDLTKTNLKYATNTSGTWVANVIDSIGNVGSDSSIALDANKKVHISYFDDTNDDLKYATNMSGEWVITSLDFYQYVGVTSSIAIDVNGAVHIAYWYGTDDELKYATNTNGTFELSILDSDGLVGFNPSIGIDSDNKIHIIHAGNGVRHTYETCWWWGDPKDTNCDGVDGVDADGDGYAGLASGGTDCDDNNSNIYPGSGCS